MAPELLRGEDPTHRSDLYALGLVLYELFTGRPAFASAKGFADRLQAGPPAAPSTVLPDIDPVVDQIVLRCLEPDPALRPPSVAAVAAALPGFDPLAEALAAGHTPSPELVAEAGHSGALKPRTAVGAFGLLLALLVGLSLLASHYGTANQLPLDKPPAVQDDRAKDILVRHGYNAKPADEAGRYVVGTYPSHVFETDHTAGRLKKVRRARPWSVLYHYRASPGAMLPHGRIVQGDDPPFIRAGMARLSLDLEGRLAAFEVVRPNWPDSAAPAAPPDWSGFFEDAGLQMSQFHEEAPLRAPDVPCDRVSGWVGVFPEEPAETLHVTAGSYRNLPVSFLTYGNWERRQETRKEDSLGAFATALAVAAVALLCAITVGVGAFVYLAYRRGKWDRRLARRTAFYLFAVTTLGWLLTSDHPAGIEALGNLPKILKQGLIVAAGCWLFYVALEPLGRRYWPHGIIGWTRLTSGRWRDPLVGRDILLGAMLGTVISILGRLEQALPGWLGHAGQDYVLTRSGEGLGLGGGARALGAILNMQVGVLLAAALLFFLYLIPRSLVRNRVASVLLTCLGYGIVLAAGNIVRQLPGESVILVVLSGAILLAGMIRFGILVTLVALYTRSLTSSFPFTWDLSRWYAGAGMVGILVVAAMGLYGARTAVKGQVGFRAEVRRGVGETPSAW
jgi:serine/threonine-protein kinase